MSPSTAERLKVGQTPFAHRSRCLKQSIYAYIFLSTYLSCYLQPSVQKRAEPLLSFNLLIWKRASRHSGVWFFIFHVARWFVPAALASPLFDPHHPQIIGKPNVLRLSEHFAHVYLLSSDFLPSLLYFFFYSCLLCFESLHIVGSLTSKISWVNFFWYAMTSW